MDKNPVENTVDKSKKKKTYKKPAVTKLGKLKDLTKFGGSGSADFFGQRA